MIFPACCELLEERLGLRKAIDDVHGETDNPSSKTGKSNKGAVGFFRGLFSKKDKHIPEETIPPQSKIQLPALNTNGRSDNANGALGTSRSQGKNATNRFTGATDNIGFEPEHDSVTKGVNKLSIDAHMFDDDFQTSRKQRKHRKTKKERHKRLREDGSSPTTFKTESSTVRYALLLFLNLIIITVSFKCHTTYGHLSRLVGKPTMWFPKRSDTNRPVQAQKRARSLKFRI